MRLIFWFIAWHCLTWTGNYQIHEIDIESGMATFSVTLCSEQVAIESKMQNH